MSASKERVELCVQPGFLLLLGILFYLSDGNGIVLMAVIAAVVHEGGHIVACKLMRGRVERLTLSMVGAELKLDYPVVLSYGRENLVLLTGSIANLLIGAILFLLGAYQITCIMVALGIFNLLPVAPLDGGRVMFNVLSQHFGPAWATRGTLVVSAVVAGILGGIGVVWAVRFANIIPLILSAWILLGLMREKTIFS